MIGSLDLGRRLTTDPVRRPACAASRDEDRAVGIQGQQVELRRSTRRRACRTGSAVRPTPTAGPPSSPRHRAVADPHRRAEQARILRPRAPAQPQSWRRGPVARDPAASRGVPPRRRRPELLAYQYLQVLPQDHPGELDSSGCVPERLAHAARRRHARPQDDTGPGGRTSRRVQQVRRQPTVRRDHQHRPRHARCWRSRPPVQPRRWPARRPPSGIGRSSEPSARRASLGHPAPSATPGTRPPRPGLRHPRRRPPLPTSRTNRPRADPAG